MAELDPSVFRRLAEGAPDVMIAHRDGVVVWANAAAARIAGLSDPAELLGREVLSFVQPANREATAADITRTLGTGAPATYAQTFLRADGTPFDAALSRWPAGDGTVLVTVQSLEPERHRRMAEARARAFFDTTTAALGVSRSGIHVEVNEAYARLFGYERPDELPGRPILDLIDPSEHDRIRDLVRRRAAGEDLPDTYRTLGRRKDGSTFALAVKASSYVDAGAVVTIVVMTDVSAEERERHRERLEAIGRLAGGVAHDFNNLLVTVLGSVELALVQEPADAPVRQHLARIGDAAQSAAELVRQILTFGRKDTPSPTPLDPVVVVGEALSLARAALPSGITLHVVAEPVGGVVLADRAQLHQIVLNLVMNARDAMDGAGDVEVRIEPVDGPPGDPELRERRWVRLRVRDEGAGIDAETRARLFEPYATTKGSAGHGLGLAVVHGVVERLGGVIRVDTAPGRGTTFDVWLPFSSAPVPPGADAPAPDAWPRTVLVVDDQPLVRDTLARLVESLGSTVLTASDGAEALAILAANPAIDLVLSDVTMPGFSGLELARRVRALAPKVRVVLCTGFADAIDESAVREVGAEALLAKPVRRARLAETLRVGGRRPAG